MMYVFGRNNESRERCDVDTIAEKDEKDILGAICRRLTRFEIGRNVAADLNGEVIRIM